MQTQHVSSQLPSPQQNSNVLNSNLQMSQINKIPQQSFIPQKQPPPQQQQQYYLPTSQNNMLPYYNFQNTPLPPQPILRLNDFNNISNNSNEANHSKSNSISITTSKIEKVESNDINVASSSTSTSTTNDIDNVKNRKNSINTDGYKVDKRRESVISSALKNIRENSNNILNDLNNNGNNNNSTDGIKESRPKCFLKFPSYPIHPAQIFQSLLQTDPIIENFKELDDFFSHKLNMKGYLNDMRTRQKENENSSTNGNSNKSNDPNYEIEEFYKFTKHLSIIELEKLYLTFNSLANSFLHWIKIKDPNYQIKPIENYPNLVFQPYTTFNNNPTTALTTYYNPYNNNTNPIINPVGGPNGMNMNMNMSMGMGINMNMGMNMPPPPPQPSSLPLIPPTLIPQQQPTQLQPPILHSKFKDNDESILKVVPFKPNTKFNSIVEFNSHGTLQPELSIQKKIICQHCGSTSTPEWRKGPEDAKTLCNACGLFHTKLVKKIGAAEAAAELRRRREIGEYNNRRI